jgi:hypothetical protein
MILFSVSVSKYGSGKAVSGMLAWGSSLFLFPVFFWWSALRCLPGAPLHLRGGNVPNDARLIKNHSEGVKMRRGPTGEESDNRNERRAVYVHAQMAIGPGLTIRQAWH